jgi:hypothetical protein
MQNALHLVSEPKKFAVNLLSSRVAEMPVAIMSAASLNDNFTPVVAEWNWTNDRAKLLAHNVKLARLLIDAGCDINHRDYQSHETPVFKAIGAKNFDLVKLFVVEGVDLSQRNLFGNDVLSRSIQLGRFRIARLLVMVDSPIRVYSLFFNVPTIEEIGSDGGGGGGDIDDAAEESSYVRGQQSNISNNESSFLQMQLSKYEEFLQFLKNYTHQPRSLIDLSRLCVRSLMHKPISKHLHRLGYLPNKVADLVLLKDIDDSLV